LIVGVIVGVGLVILAVVVATVGRDLGSGEPGDRSSCPKNAEPCPEVH
jgi:hypothetical protein